MCGYIRVDGIRNWVINNKVTNTPIEHKMREIRLKWFCHVKKRSLDTPVGKYDMINLLECRRGRIQSKKGLN